MLESALVYQDSEVIVVNNGNPEKVNARLQSYQDHPQFKLIEGQGNVGFAKACNLGAAKASAEVLLFLNPDSVIDINEQGDNAAVMLFDIYQTLSPKTLLGGRVINEDGTPQRGMARNILTPISLLIEMSMLYRLFPFFKKYRFNLENNAVPQPLCQMGAISGSCMMISQSFYQQLNGFDEGYFLHFEDVDLCHRVWHAKGQVMLYNKAQFKHIQGSSEASGQIVERHKYQGFCRYFKCHFPIVWYSPLGWFFKAVFYLRTVKKVAVS